MKELRCRIGKREKDENFSVYNDMRDKIEVVNESIFIEYTKEGYAAIFTVTVVESYKRWDFDNDRIGRLATKAIQWYSRRGQSNICSFSFLYLYTFKNRFVIMSEKDRAGRLKI